MTKSTVLIPHIEETLTNAEDARLSGNIDAAWSLLAKAHILSQPLLRPHLRVHAKMLSLAFLTRNLREIFGQLVRLLLAPLGQAFQKTPWGNSGLSSVSPFSPSPLTEEIKNLYRQAGIKVKNNA